MAAQKLNFREKIVIKILLIVAGFVAENDELKKEVTQLSTHINYAKDDA